MGTTETQVEIKRLLGKLKWSQKRLGREFYYAKHEYENDPNEIIRYEEKVKKDLSRESTKLEVLQSYLDIIAQHNEFQKLDLVIPIYKRSSILSEEMEMGMADISELINKMTSD
ncbi:hypothetical protein SAMN02745127_01817 [Oceanospirillum multiglobuliferum]|uniref:Uncharacterized protein n=1 Tax=Oceanospirillum multiglobuliferum TaxID=64969 RepID=A0A1T4QB17_9GAMM|nr:hypothetical protein [Oceanospirillum multiglobuliferum]OPX56543.1 hypothetical protein BTE48_03725 [Oceanospirillum multiglobuliferum]SKA00895.1 hypothetical protein SAMN02745127_01817 [Oceanospirillum multiglobuliferum]